MIPKKHYKDIFELPSELGNELVKMIKKIKQIIDKEFKPDAYNIGINNGNESGKTIFHLHIHIIPRYKGDVKIQKEG